MPQLHSLLLSQLGQPDPGAQVVNELHLDWLDRSALTVPR